MSFRLKNFISTFFFLVFLFPTATEIVHSYCHSNDLHCTERLAIHFHESEHHCTICDYIPVTSNKTTFQFFTSFIPNLSLEYFTLYRTISFEQHKYHFSLRGPPMGS